MLRGVNDDELVDLIEFGRGVDAEVRFIEYMDVGGATHWSRGTVFSRAEMLDAARPALRDDHAAQRNSSAPGRALPLPDGTVFGIIASTTHAVLPRAATAAA